MRQPEKYADWKTRTRHTMGIQYKNLKNTFIFKSKIELKSTTKAEGDYKAESLRCPLNYLMSQEVKSEA